MDPETSVLANEDQLQSAPETVDETVLTGADGADSASGETENVGQQGTAQFDWESNDNPYKVRLAGIQGPYQQAIEKARAEEAKRIEYEDRLFEVEIAELPAEDKVHARAALTNARQQQVKTQEMTQQQATLNELAREIVTSRIAQTHGVPVAELAQFNDPYAMETYAKAIAAARRTVRKEGRKATQADKFESGASVSQSSTKSFGGDLDAAALAFAKLAAPTRR